MTAELLTEADGEYLVDVCMYICMNTMYVSIYVCGFN
jgi:hypothetical protein